MRPAGCVAALGAGHAASGPTTNRDAAARTCWPPDARRPIDARDRHRLARPQHPAPARRPTATARRRRGARAWSPTAARRTCSPASRRVAQQPVAAASQVHARRRTSCSTASTAPDAHRRALVGRRRAESSSTRSAATLCARMRAGRSCDDDRVRGRRPCRVRRAAPLHPARRRRSRRLAPSRRCPARCCACSSRSATRCVAGQPLLTIEAMKMEHQVVVARPPAPWPRCSCSAGQQLDTGQPLRAGRPGDERAPTEVAAGAHRQLQRVLRRSAVGREGDGRRRRRSTCSPATGWPS